MAIEGTRWFEYKLYGEIPPNVPDAMIEGAILSSVTVVGTLLPHIRGASVVVHEKLPPGVAAELQGGKIIRQ